MARTPSFTTDDVLRVIGTGYDNVFSIAAWLGVPHTNATLRATLKDLANSGTVVASGPDGATKTFTVAAN